MKTKDMKRLLSQRASTVISTESNNGVDGLPFTPVDNDTPPTDEVNTAADIVHVPELLTELDDALKDVDMHVAAVESLLVVADTVAFGNSHPSTSLESSIVSYLSQHLPNAESGQRMMASLESGGLHSTADIVAFEDMASNAAKSHWNSIAKRITVLSQKNGELSNITAEAGKRISDQFKALKSQVWAYKGKNNIKVGHLVSDGNTLAQVILNTQQAALLDISLKNTLPLDKAIDELASKSTGIISKGQSDQLSAITATAVKTAHSLSGAYTSYINEPNVLGYVRSAMDDETTLPQGIVSALTGADRKYNYPRYKRISRTGTSTEELTPQLAKQLYEVGIRIGQDIVEQSRAWDMRLNTLKGLAGLAKQQAGNVDADKNTWAAEQRATANILTMWSTNASARRYYISVYNKIASQILDLLNSATAVSGKAALESYSQELFGFGKPKAVKLEDGIAYFRSNVDKVKPGQVTSNGSLLGADVDKEVTAILTNVNNLVKVAIPCYAQAAKATAVFERNDDEDELDESMLKALTPFIRYVGNGRSFNGYEITANAQKEYIDGEFTLPAAVDVTYDVDSDFIKRLLLHVDNLTNALTKLHKVRYLEYGQGWCDWSYSLRLLIEATRKQLIDIALKALGNKVTISQELFGWGKKKEEPKTTPATTAPKYRTPDELLTLMQSDSFVECNPDISLNMLGYNADFNRHATIALQAYKEYSQHYTDTRFQDFIKTVNGLTDNLYNRLIDSDLALADDWRKQGNELLNEIYNRLLEDGVYLKYWNMTRVANNGVRTNFALQPNITLDSNGHKEDANPKLSKLTISKVHADAAVQFLKQTKDIQTWEITDEMAKNRFLSTFPKFEDSFIQMIYSPVLAINANMDDLLSLTHDLISKSIVVKDTE